MAKAGKTFRVFVSSTFSDLKAERNALQKHVFPRLRELCASYGTRFQAIDLRWGVSIEAGLDQRTMRLCLQELKRCQNTTPKPNFLVLLGDRYGWEPLPEEIPEKEFKEIQRKVREDPQTFNPLADPAEMDALSLLDKWYRCDDNNDPPIHVLQPRTGEYEEFDVWQRRGEGPLRAILRTAIRFFNLDDDARSRYEFSATHQEIHHGALKVEDASHHVFACYRKIRKLNLENGDVVPKPLHDFVDGPVDEAGTKRFDGPAHDRCEALKDELERTVGEANVHEHKVQVTPAGITTDHVGDLPEKWEDCLALLDEPLPDEAPLCRQVWHDLGRVIREECQALQEVDPLQLETEAHAAFREERARIFVGREDLLTEATDAPDAPPPYPLVFHGASGSGKSAFMAAVAARVARTRALADMHCVPMYASPIQRPDGAPIKPQWTGEAILVERFIGATPASTRIRPLLESLCRILVAAYDAGDFGPAEKFDELVKQFHDHLSLACEERPLVILLDAVNQLADDEHARLLNWLPTVVPPHVTVMLSTTSDDAPCLEAARKRWPPSGNREVKPLSRDEGKEILEALLGDVGRKLDDDQEEEVLRRFATNGLPLYLKLAFEEARRWRSWEGVPSYRGRTGLAPGVSGIIGNLFWRLSQPKEHGALLVSRSLGYLVAARNGLTEDEMLGVLALDEEFVKQFTDHPFHPVKGTVPVAVWSRLYHDLEPYLTWRAADGTELLGFYHPQVGEVAKEEFLGGTEKPKRHEGLAGYFAGQGNFFSTGDRRLPNVRRCSELPFQATQADQKRVLEETLTDVFFIEAKCLAGLTEDLVRDYLAAVDHSSDRVSWPGRDRIAGFQFFVARDAHILRQHPELAFQRAANSPDNTEPAQAAQRLSADGAFKRPWVRWVNKPQEGTSLLRTLSGHGGSINGAAFSPDERRILTWSGDSTARVWDVETGATVHLLDQHEKGIYRAEYSPDGGRIVTASDDGTAILWDASTGALVRRVPFASPKPRDFRTREKIPLVPPKGEIFVALAESNTVALHDLADGRTRHTLSGHDGAICDLVWSADGRLLATASEDTTARIWDPFRGALVHILQGHKQAVSQCLFSADGQLIVTNSKDGSIAFWGLRNGQRVGEISGWAHGADNLALSPDGSYLVFRPAEKHLTITGSWSGDAFRRATNLSEEEEKKARDKPAHMLALVALRKNTQAKLTGHLAIPSQSRFAPGSRHLFSAAKDGTIRRWDLESNRSTVVLEGPLNTHWRFEFSRDRGYIAAVGGDEWALVDLATGETAARAPAPLSNRLYPALSGDGRLLLTSAPGNGVSIWDIAAARAETGTRLALPPIRKVEAISPGGDTLAHQVTYQTWGVHDLARGEALPQLEHSSGAFSGAAFSPDGNVLAHVPGRKLVLDQVRTGERLHELDVTTGFVRGVAFSPSGDTLAALDSAGCVTLWDVETGLLLGASTEGPETGPLAEVAGGAARFELVQQGHVLGFSPDGRSLYFGSGNNGLTEVDAQTAQPRRRVAELGGRRTDVKPMVIRQQDGRRVPQETPFEHVISAFDISPDGSFLATIHSSRILTAWEHSDGRQLRQREYRAEALKALAFSPDGRHLALAFADRTVRLVDASTFAEVARKLEAPAESLGFREGGREVVTGPEFYRLAWEGVECGQPAGVSRPPGRPPLAGVELEAARTRTSEWQEGIMGSTGETGAGIKMFAKMVQLDKECRAAHGSMDLDRLLAAAGKLEALAEVSDHAGFLQAALEFQGFALANSGNPVEALARFERQERVCEEAGMEEELARCKANQRLIRSKMARSATSGRPAPDPEIISLGRRADGLRQQGDIDGALEGYARLEEVCRRVGDDLALHQSLGVQASLLLGKRRIDEALAKLSERADILRKIGDSANLAPTLGNLGLVLADKGQFGEAYAHFDEQEGLLRQQGDEKQLALSLFKQADFLRRKGQVDAALDRARKANALYNKLGDNEGSRNAAGLLGALQMMKRRPRQGVVRVRVTRKKRDDQ